MLQIRDLTYKVEEAGEEKLILDHLSLDISDGKFTVITGPNGGGKSTLAKLIAGIIQPTSGSIILDGEDITDMSITDRSRRGVSFAFQQPVKFKGLEVSNMAISTISVSRGRTIPGHMPRAHGRATPWNQETVNLEIIIQEVE